MAFFGKVFVVDKEENYEEFVKSIGLPDEKAKSVLEYKPSQKIEKNGDSYTTTIYTKNGEKVYNFKSGEEFATTFRELPVKVKIDVDENKMTQVIKFEVGFTMTVKKEYTDDSLSEEITHSGWDGVARRFYKSQ